MGINVQNADKQTALHLAVRYGNIELAKCLLAKGADVTVRNGDSRTVMELMSRDLREDFAATMKLSAAMTRNCAPLLQSLDVRRIR